MSQLMAQKPLPPDLHVVHAISGRIRLRTNQIRGRAQQAQEVARRLAAIRGVHRAEANATTGSITLHYHPSALDSVKFFAEIAAALGLIASGLEPSEVEALFQVVGVSPAEIRASLGAGIGSKLSLPIAFFAMGFLVSWSADGLARAVCSRVASGMRPDSAIQPVKVRSCYTRRGPVWHKL